MVARSTAYVYDPKFPERRTKKIAKDKAYNKANAEAIIAYRKKYYRRNRERIIAQTKRNRELRQQKATEGNGGETE